jgi:hypothetical protein
MRKDNKEYILLFLKRREKDLLAHINKRFGMQIVKVFIREELNYLQNFPLELNFNLESKQTTNQHSNDLSQSKKSITGNISKKNTINIVPNIINNASKEIIIDDINN